MLLWAQDADFTRWSLGKDRVQGCVFWNRTWNFKLSYVTLEGVRQGEVTVCCGGISFHPQAILHLWTLPPQAPPSLCILEWPTQWAPLPVAALCPWVGGLDWCCVCVSLGMWPSDQKGLTKSSWETFTHGSSPDLGVEESKQAQRLTSHQLVMGMAAGSFSGHFQLLLKCSWEKMTQALNCQKVGFWCSSSQVTMGNSLMGNSPTQWLFRLLDVRESCPWKEVIGNGLVPLQTSLVRDAGFSLYRLT